MPQRQGGWGFQHTGLGQAGAPLDQLLPHRRVVVRATARAGCPRAKQVTTPTSQFWFTSLCIETEGSSTLWVGTCGTGEPETVPMGPTWAGRERAEPPAAPNTLLGRKTGPALLSRPSPQGPPPPRPGSLLSPLLSPRI